MSPLPRSHQEIVEQLDLMLRARYPLIYIVGAEEEPIETHPTSPAKNPTFPKSRVFDPTSIAMSGFAIDWA
jgi:hypothetical protein